MMSNQKEEYREHLESQGCDTEHLDDPMFMKFMQSCEERDLRQFNELMINGEITTKESNDGQV